MSALWKELHIRALNFEKKPLDETAKRLERVYLLKFGQRIPRYTTGCRCKEFWDNWYRSNPPTFEKYFEWTVKTHNAVNKKLGKPEISVDQARQIYP